MASYTPSTPEEFAFDWLLGELFRISQTFEEQYDLPVTNTAPNKPRRGWIRYADGTNWNPGSGEGLYRYNGSAWVLVG